MATSQQARAHSATEIAKRRRDVAERFLARETTEEIAAALKVSLRTVARDLKYLKGQWASEAGTAIAEAKARELAELDRMEAECVRAFNQTKDSAKDAVRSVRFMALRLKIKDQRARLLGLHAQQASLVLGLGVGGGQPGAAVAANVAATTALNDAVAAAAAELGIDLTGLLSTPGERDSDETDDIDDADDTDADLD